MGKSLDLAIVVQRFGDGVVGGSEEHCRAIAERLAINHNVTILTSCAKDYVSWRPEYRSGVSTEGPLTIRRFRNRRRRKTRWAEINEVMLSEDTLPEEESTWFSENGPRVPSLLRYLQQHGGEYDAVLFWTYRYYPSHFGLPLVADRSILVPTAEEDPAIQMSCLSEFFRLPQGYLFLTPEERDLVTLRAGSEIAPSAVIGSGLDPVSANDAELEINLERFGIDGPFALYVGRVDPNKGCSAMFRHYLRYIERAKSPLQLVIAGRAVMDIPQSPLIKALGYVSDEEREALLCRASLLIMPSPYESLSIALLEAWNHARPALVNGRCKVLKGQITRADGGLYYENPEEFVESLDFLVSNPEIARQLGRQGLEYVEQNYRWSVVMRRIEKFLQQTLENR